MSMVKTNDYKPPVSINAARSNAILAALLKEPVNEKGEIKDAKGKTSIVNSMVCNQDTIEEMYKNKTDEELIAEITKLENQLAQAQRDNSRLAELVLNMQKNQKITEELIDALNDYNNTCDFGANDQFFC